MEFVAAGRGDDRFLEADQADGTVLIGAWLGFLQEQISGRTCIPPAAAPAPAIAAAGSDAECRWQWLSRTKELAYCRQEALRCWPPRGGVGSWQGCSWLWRRHITTGLPRLRLRHDVALTLLFLQAASDAEPATQKRTEGIIYAPPMECPVRWWSSIGASDFFCWAASCTGFIIIPCRRGRRVWLV